MMQTFKKRNPLVVVLVLAIALFAVALYVFFSSRRPSELPTSVFGIATSTPSLTSNVKIESSKEETNSYQIETGIPQFENPGDSFALQFINKQIKDNVAEAVRAFKDELVQIQQETPGGIFNDAGLPKHSLLINPVKAHEVGGRYFVVELKDFSYITGSAHPFTSTITYNFDLKTGDLIKLEDLYRDKAQFLQAVSTYTRKELQPKLESFFEEGIAPDERNFSIFTLEEGAVRFVFDQYQVAPYAAGEQEVVMPASALSGLLKIQL